MDRMQANLYHKLPKLKIGQLPYFDCRGFAGHPKFLGRLPRDLYPVRSTLLRRPVDGLKIETTGLRPTAGCRPTQVRYGWFSELFLGAPLLAPDQREPESQKT